MAATATIEKPKTKQVQKPKTVNKAPVSKAKKTATISMRVEPNIKKEAEEVCARAGLSITNAIDMFLYQIVRTQGIPVDVTSLPPCPGSVNLDLKSRDKFLKELDEALADAEIGNVFSFDEIKDDIKGLYDD